MLGRFQEKNKYSLLEPTLKEAKTTKVQFYSFTSLMYTFLPSQRSWINGANWNKYISRVIKTLPFVICNRIQREEGVRSYSIWRTLESESKQPALSAGKWNACKLVLFLCLWLDKNVTRDDLFIKFSWPTSRAKQREATEFRILGGKLTKIQRKCERRFLSPKLARLLPPKTSLFRWKAALSSRRPELASVYKETHAKRWLLDCVSKEKHSCFCLLLISSRPTFMFRLFLSLLFHHRHTWECCRERKILHILLSKLFQFSLTKTVFVLRKLTILYKPLQIG